MNAQTLRDLLQAALDKRAEDGLPVDFRSVEKVVKDEEKARPRGLALNRTTISQILKGTYKKVPEDGTIRAIGWLAGVSDEIAFTAAGHRPQGPPFASELPQGVNDLSPTERGAALDMLRILVAQRQVINRYESVLAPDPSPSSGAPGKAGQVQKTDGPDDGDADPERPGSPDEPEPDPLDGLDRWRDDGDGEVQDGDDRPEKIG